MTNIEWTQETWNPLTGCTKVSSGCENCYAIRMAHRLSHIPHSKNKYAGTVEKTKGGRLNWTGQINTDHVALQYPYRFKKPTTFFVNSMSDLFHENVSFDFIRYVFLTIKDNPMHTFQILTKRPERAVEFFKEMRDRGSSFGYESPGNVILGISAENMDTYKKRCIYFYSFKQLGYTTMLSAEPLLGGIDLMIDGIMGNLIDWVIVGGESGPNARPMHPGWVYSIRDQCINQKVPFFFKQWGEWGPEFSWLSLHKCCEINISGKYALYNERADFFSGNRNTLELVAPSVTMYRNGKKLNGNLIDGIAYLQTPEI